MPKINGSSIPSYEGHEGVVENAHGQLFNVDPTKDLDGRDTDGNKTDDGHELIASPDAEPVRLQSGREGAAETERLDTARAEVEENPPAFGHDVPQSEDESTRAQREKSEDKGDAQDEERTSAFAKPANVPAGSTSAKRNRK